MTSRDDPRAEWVSAVQLMCAGFTIGVLFMAAVAHWNLGTLCTRSW